MANQYNAKDINKAVLQSFLKEMTIEQVARHFNCHRDTIRKKIKRFGLSKSFSHGESPKKNGPAVAKFAITNGIDQACAKFDKTPKQVEKYLMKLKYGEYKDDLR